MKLPACSRSILFAFLSVLAHLAASTAMAGEFFEKDGVALRGYDAVSYFVTGKSQRGLPAHAHTFKGSKFYFASAANRDKFVADPEKYAPQFGGYCAYGTAQGYKVSTQPDAFAVIDNKLYMNYNRDVQKMWVTDTAGNIAKAEANWPAVAKSEQKD